MTPPEVLLKAARLRHPQYRWEYEPVFGVCMAIAPPGIPAHLPRYRVLFTPLEAIVREGV